MPSSGKASAFRYTMDGAVSVGDTGDDIAPIGMSADRRASDELNSSVEVREECFDGVFRFL